MYDATPAVVACATLAHDGDTASLRQLATIASSAVAGTVTLEPVRAAAARGLRTVVELRNGVGLRNGVDPLAPVCSCQRTAATTRW